MRRCCSAAAQPHLNATLQRFCCFSPDVCVEWDDVARWQTDVQLRLHAMQMWCGQGCQQL